jgi:hypothetical protein
MSIGRFETTRQGTFTGPLVIAVGLTLTVFCAWTIPITILPSVALVATIVVLLALRLSLVAAASIGILITTAGYRGLFLALRSDAGGLNLGLYDILWLLMLARVLIAFMGGRKVKLDLGLILFLVTAILILLLGFVEHQPIYNTSKMLRTVVLLIVGWLIASMLDDRERCLALKAMVWGGTVTALSQIVTFLFALRGLHIWSLLGIATRQTDSNFEVDTSISSSFRDNGVTILFAGFAVVIILVFKAYGSTIVPEQIYRAALAICVIGLLLSLTRSVWMMTLVGGMVLMFLTRQFSWRLVLKAGGWGGIILLISFALQFLGQGTTTIGQVVGERFISIGNLAHDATGVDRLRESSAALELLGNKWPIGLGAANVSYYSEVGINGQHWLVRNQLHNGFLQYIVVGGVLGLTTILVSFVRALYAGYMASRNALSRDVGAVAASSVCLLAMVFFGAFLGGIINDSFVSPIVGMLFGLALPSSAAPSAPNLLRRAHN